MAASAVGPLLVPAVGVALDGYGPVLNLLTVAGIAVAALAAVGTRLGKGQTVIA